MISKALIAMGCITFLEALALFLGYNGTILSLSVGLISGLGGYEIAKTGKKESSRTSEGS